MRKHTLASICVLMLGASAFSFTGHAQENAEEKPPSKAMLKKYDLDHDGKISPEEREQARAGAKARRDARRRADREKYDANHDGKLDKDEREKMKADREAEMAEHKKDRDARKARKAGEAAGASH